MQIKLFKKNKRKATEENAVYQSNENFTSFIFLKRW